MNIGQKGLNLIKKYEGCSLMAYQDSSNIWTIGYGWTGKINGKSISKGMKISQQQADNLLLDNLILYENKVNKYQNIYHFNQNEFDALVSFCYNIGNIDQLTNNGKRTRGQIKDHWIAYCKSNGKILQGLINRRKAELELFNQKDNNYITVYKNNQPINLQAVNINGNNYIKLRDIEKISNLKVEYINGVIYIK